MNQDVHHYLNSLKKWQEELTKLRNIIMTCNLNEDYKWMRPCYTNNGKNILLIHEFKDYCAVLFHKGALLKDPEKILIQQTEHTQSARQIRFSDLSEIEKLAPIIKTYIEEAIQIEKFGLKVKKKKTSDYKMPTELEQTFQQNPKFEKAFKKLTPGRQNGYLIYFSKPKQPKTIISRIEKNMERIFDGFGLNECTCGLSKRKPNCDGSHKQWEEAL